jgi:type I restriction enzyme S subunit
LNGNKRIGIGRIPEEWRTFKLGDVADIFGGATPSTKVAYYWNGEIPFVTPTDVTNLKEGNILKSTEKNITRAGFKSISAKCVPAGSVLLTSRATIGFCCINETRVVTNQGFINLICKGDLHNVYALYLLRSLKNELERLSNGSTFKELARSTFRKISVVLPPLEEQLKITTILSMVDDSIQNSDKIIAKTQQLKKGIMRQLFTRGVGQEAFKQTKIGEVPENWLIRKLGDVCKISTGGTPATSNRSYYQGSIPFIKTSDIINRRITEATTYVSEKAVKECNLKLFPPKTIFLAMYGQGKTRGQSGILEISATTTQNTAAIVANAELDPEFLWYWLMSRYEDLRRVGAQGQISHLNLGYVERYEIALPPLKEQQTIALILSAVDEKSDKERKTKRALESLETGLMQDLLTGKVRVTVT